MHGIVDGHEGIAAAKGTPQQGDWVEELLVGALDGEELCLEVWQSLESVAQADANLEERSLLIGNPVDDVLASNDGASIVDLRVRIRRGGCLRE